MNGKALKQLALLTMLTDHIAASVIYILKSASNPELLKLYVVLRNIGRFAFPVYCFLLVEGYIHSRNIKKYFLNLLFFSIVSEIPFNMTVSRGGLFYPEHQNVMLTLLFGVAVMYLIEKILYFFPVYDMKRYYFVLAVIIGIGAVSFYLKTDYRGIGVLVISAMYLIRIKDNAPVPSKTTLFLMAGCGVLMLYLRSVTELYAVSAIPFIVLYNGKRGNIVYKMFYYWAYPIHLFILGLICKFMLKG